MDKQSSDLVSGVCVHEKPINVGLEACADTAVSHARRASGELDGAGRRQNGRELSGYHRAERVLREAKDRQRALYNKRTTVGRENWEKREAYIDACGGEAALSPQRLEIIDSAVRTSFLLSFVDGYLAEIGPKAINRRKKALVPLVEQRTKLADSLLRHLQAIGLERRAKPAETLAEYAQRIAAEDQSGGTSVS